MVVSRNWIPVETPLGQGCATSTKIRVAGVLWTVEITARVPNERLAIRYADSMLEVSADFRIATTAGGARLSHTIQIDPKNLLAKAIAPIIRKQLPQQTIASMEKLRAFLQSAS